MPIRLRVDESPRSVRFALLPAAEAVMSLHVLLYPKVHSLQHPWVRTCRALPAELRRDVRAFAFLYADAFPDCFLPPDGEMRPSWEQQLDVVAALDPQRAAYELARPLFFYFEAAGGGPERLDDPDVRRTALAFARDRAGDDGARLAALAFDDPAGSATASLRSSRRTGTKPSVTSGVASSRSSPRLWTPAPLRPSSVGRSQS